MQEIQTKHKGKSSFKKKKLNVFNKKNTKPSEDEEITRLQARYDSIIPKEVSIFADLPLSWKTLKGLKECGYMVPTEIQRESIGLALQGKDILGAAITGSGKTLAFLIPVLEKLFLKKWSRMDGIGAIIISPTRELAYQIFETLRKVGAYHDFSAGLIIGGKNLKFERTRMDQCNLIICTPGRLLQHMDENPLFNCSTMSILVLDEADRCLDMGFQEVMNAIIENLPPERQTLLFSATQTKSVKDLARLSLVDPAYVAPHEQQLTTPDSLKQNYVVVDLEDKITMLWSFIKNHLKQKCIIFMSSCKQVKYVYEIFCKMRPGVSLLALYGTLHQDRRMAIYDDFCRKNRVVLFATDIASRGLDFPVVNWVVQLDCPEDATQYIHRAGRTARHKASGESLLVLMPSEEEIMVEDLSTRKVPINKIYIDAKKLFSPRAKMEALLAANKELKESAQRAFVAYIKSVFLMKNKKVFNVEKLDTDAFAASLGLVVTPRIRFLERLRKKKVQTGIKISDQIADSILDSDIESDKKNPKKNRKILFDQHNESSEDGSDEDDFIKVKRRDHEIVEELSGDNEVESNALKKSDKNQKTLTKAALAKRIIKKKIVANKKVVFDDEGDAVTDPAKQAQSLLAREYEQSTESGIDIETAKRVLREEDKFDKQRFRELNKVKRKAKKEKLKARESGDANSDGVDEFGSESDINDVDTSWLPDPDKIYSPKVVCTDSEEEESVPDGKCHKLPRKLVEKRSAGEAIVRNGSDSSSAEDHGSDDEEDIVKQPLAKKAKKITNNLSIDEAEMLAMQLLGKK